MRKLLKNNIKLIIGIIIGLVLCGSGMYAATLLNSNQVLYVNSKTVKEALDELYSKADSCEEGEYYPGLDSSGMLKDPYGNPRFVGLSPMNYVSFNNELWRIIGVFDGRLKIMRHEHLFDEKYDSSNYDINRGEGINNWATSELAVFLNTTYIDPTITSSVYYGSDSVYPNELLQSSEALNMIDTVIWYTGAPNNKNGVALSNGEELTISFIYEHERSNLTGKICSGGEYCNDTVPRTTQWLGKIGVIYPSDFFYTTIGSDKASRKECINATNNNFYKLSCNQYTWMKNLKGEYSNSYGNHEMMTISPLADAFFGGKDASLVAIINGNGYLTNDSAFRRHDVWPTLYLKPTVRITGGSGSEKNPYTLSL